MIESTEKVILLIEDNPDDVLLTLRALKRANVANRVVVTRNGAEAVDYLLGGEFGKQEPLPTLVLLDLKLPKISGLEVLRRIRSHDRTRQLPVVILTSSIEEKDVAGGYGLGANSYIRKPVDFDRFTDAVAQLGLYWLLLNEAPLHLAAQPVSER